MMTLMTKTILEKLFQNGHVVRFFFKIILCCIISTSEILDFLIILSKFIGSAFRAQLMHQCYNMPDVDMIFTGMTIFYFIYHIYIFKKNNNIYFKFSASCHSRFVGHF